MVIDQVPAVLNPPYIARSFYHHLVTNITRNQWAKKCEVGIYQLVVLTLFEPEEELLGS